MLSRSTSGSGRPYTSHPTIRPPPSANNAPTLPFLDKLIEKPPRSSRSTTIAIPSDSSLPPPTSSTLENVPRPKTAIQHFISAGDSILRALGAISPISAEGAHGKNFLVRKVAHLQLEKVDNDQDGGAVENSLDDKCKEVGKLKDTNWKESRYEIPRRPQTAVERIVSAGLVAGGEVLKARAQSIVWDAAKAGVEAAAREVVSVCTGNSGKI